NDIKEQLPDEFYLCGFSFGGYIALELLEQMPERILGLIMIGSTCRGDTEKQKLGRQKIVEGIERGNYEKMIETNKEWLFGEDFSSENKMKLYEDMANSYGAHTYIAHLQATMSREDKTNLLI